MASKRSQVSIEMMGVIGIVLVIFATMSFIAFDIYSERQREYDSSEAENQCIRLSEIVLSLYTSGPGTAYNTSIKYNTTFLGGKSIAVDTGEMQAHCNSFVNSTNGTSDSFRVEDGNLMMINDDGMIKIITIIG